MGLIGLNQAYFCMIAALYHYMLYVNVANCMLDVTRNKRPASAYPTFLALGMF